MGHKITTKYALKCPVVTIMGDCLAGNEMSPKRNSVFPSPLALLRVIISAEG
jgi:hypothetical protein